MSDPDVLAWAKKYADQRSVTALAELTGCYGRTAISLYLNGKYPAGVEAIEAVLRPLMDSRPCPYLEREITADDCVRRHNNPRPNHAGSDMEAHWDACQSCQYKRHKEETTP